VSDFVPKKIDFRAKSGESFESLRETPKPSPGEEEKWYFFQQGLSSFVKELDSGALGFSSRADKRD